MNAFIVEFQGGSELRMGHRNAGRDPRPDGRRHDLHVRPLRLQPHS